ncbi:MAG: ABC transporter substrate-binding protein [Acidimicrobiales bacterium]|nr:ABC transporter substrate-binding protein [Acidimicrobiales bacterium]MYB82893.1 ABC transporter substrate-binding protein [Acidimicrobiales bacterium]MYI12988.1 ABC transporter substrate-binding protein [Acidimicrobiales bacterium]
MANSAKPTRRTALAIAAAVLMLAACGSGSSTAEDEDQDKPAPTAAASTTVSDDDSDIATTDAAPTTVQGPTATTAAGAANATEDDDAQAVSTEPIKLGAVSTLTGPASFPESHSAAQAVFDRVNAAGGINGRMIEYFVEDDGFDPALAAQGARRLGDEINVVALVGSASVLECAVNAQYYAEVGLFAIQGTGIDPVCFATSNISPVNTGPFFSDAVALFYASEELGVASCRRCNRGWA